MAEMGVRCAHKQGEVYLTWNDGSDQAHARLDPDDAETLAKNIVNHIALARKQLEKAAETKPECSMIDLLNDIDDLEEDEDE